MRTPTSKPRVHAAVYDDVPQADRAVWELVHAGIPKERITVICPTCTHEKYQDLDKEQPAGSHTAGAAVTGGAIGALLGGLVMVAGTAATGGAALVAAGPLLFASGTGALWGGFVGAMMTRGVEREVADFYDQALQKGQVLVAVEPSDEVDVDHIAIADRIFAETGAERVNLRKA